MQMGDKHMTEVGESNPAFTQLHLSSLSTIQHQHLFSHFDHLRWCIMAKCGKSTTTT